MSVAVWSYVMYGVRLKPSDVLEEVTHEEHLNCHPDANDEGDTFCSVCGEKLTKTSTQIRVKEEFEDYLPEVPDRLWKGYQISDIGITSFSEDYLDYGTWPEGRRALDFETPGGGYSDISYGFLGHKLNQTGDLMYGDNAKPTKLFVHSGSIDKAKQALIDMGFDEDDIGFYQFACVG